MDVVILAIVVTSLVIGSWVIIRFKSNTFRSVTLGWKLLWLSGLMFVPRGMIWIMKWQPLSGPYMVGERYPFGNYVNAWEVSMGFAFVAFGVLFAEASILVCKSKNRLSWVGLLISWVLLMFPHALIGVTFVLDDPSLASFGISVYAIPFAVIWFLIVFSGFVLFGREIIP